MVVLSVDGAAHAQRDEDATGRGVDAPARGGTAAQPVPIRPASTPTVPSLSRLPIDRPAGLLRQIYVTTRAADRSPAVEQLVGCLTSALDKNRRPTPIRGRAG